MYTRKIEQLKEEHAKIEQELLEAEHMSDEHVTNLKKEKLRLKDLIAVFTKQDNDGIK